MHHVWIGASQRSWENRIGSQLNLHPGVDALGYVNNTTPDLLLSTRSFNLSFVPSWFSNSPPNWFKSRVSPTFGDPWWASLDASAREPPALTFLGPLFEAGSRSRMRLLFCSVSRGCVVALRFLNSTIAILWLLNNVNTVNVMAQMNKMSWNTLKAVVCGCSCTLAQHSNQAVGETSPGFHPCPWMPSLR